jgi:hypothetical protein
MAEKPKTPPESPVHGGLRKKSISLGKSSPLHPNTLKSPVCGGFRGHLYGWHNFSRSQPLHSRAKPAASLTAVTVSNYGLQHHTPADFPGRELGQLPFDSLQLPLAGRLIEPE